MSFANSDRSVSRGESLLLSQAKTIIIGDSTVGKSSIIWRFLSKEFKLNTPPTVGLDFNSKCVKIDEDNELKLIIWDTAGQEKYRCLVSNFFRDSHGALLVFDLTSKESFEGINKIWLELLNKNAPEKVCKVAMANKCDKSGEIEVTDEEISDFEKKFNIKCFKTSAKDNIGIDESFVYLAKKMSETFMFTTQIDLQRPMNIQIEPKKPKPIKCDNNDDNSDISKACCK